MLKGQARTDYMREYMRNRRAAMKQSPSKAAQAGPQQAEIERLKALLAAEQAKKAPPQPEAAKPQHDTAALENRIRVLEAELVTERARKQQVHQVKRAAKAEPTINREDLSMTAQQKFDVAIRQENRRLAVEFTKAVQAEVEERIGFLLRQVKADQCQAYKDMTHARRGGFKFKAPVYKKILHALHPDSRHSISDERLAEAFQAFGDSERYLLAPPEPASKHPQPPPLPTTMEELMAARERVRQQNSTRARGANARRQKIKAGQ